MLCDFFSRLTEEQFDFRMVDAPPSKKADTPRFPSFIQYWGP